MFYLKKITFKVNYKVKFGSPGNNLYSWPKNFGESIVKFSKSLILLNLI